MPDVVALSLLILVVLLAGMAFPLALDDLAVRLRGLRSGAVPLQRPTRGGYAAHSHGEAYSAPVRKSPGHRNFGIPARPGGLSDFTVLDSPVPTEGAVARHVFSDH